MEPTSTMNFLRERDFGQTINATFRFYKENWKGLMTALVYYALPVAGISLLAIYYFGLLEFMDNLKLGRVPDPYEILGKMGLFMFLFVLTYITMSGTVYSYCSLYHERRGNSFSTAEVGNRLLNTIGVYIKTILLFFAIFIVAVIIIALIIAATGSQVLLPLFLAIVAAYFAVSFFSIFIVQIVERKGLFEAISRCMGIIKGNWWYTLGILIALGVVIGLIGLIPELILQYAMGVSMFNSRDLGFLENPSTYLIASASLSMVVRLFVGPLMIIAIVFHYFSLVEKKEKTSLLEDVHNIGSTDNNVNPYSGQEESY